jgi:hypothetical protein
MENIKDGFYGVKDGPKSHEWIVSIKGEEVLAPWIWEDRAEVSIYKKESFLNSNSIIREIPREIFIEKMERVGKSWQKFTGGE